MAAHPVFEVEGKVVVITGAARGIGAGIARLFAQAGARVAMTFHRDEANAREVLSSLSSPHARLYQLDVANSPQVRAVFAEVRSDFERIDVLVNNAGAYPHSDALSMEETEWDEVFAINTKGSYLCARAAAEVMRASGTGGRIINISSIAALQPERSFSHYSASKGALISLTRSLALEWAEYGIAVNVILPGLIDGGSLHRYVPERARAYETLAPMHRAGTPDDIGGVVLFLASSAARFITGQSLVVDGGALLGGYMELARGEAGAPTNPWTPILGGDTGA